MQAPNLSPKWTYGACNASLEVLVETLLKFRDL